MFVPQRALQRQPEVPPGRRPHAGRGPGAGLRAGLGRCSTRRSWPRCSAWPGAGARATVDAACCAGALRRVRPRLRHPLQPEQRRQLRRGAGPRHLGPVLAVRWWRRTEPAARRALALALGAAARAGLLVPHPGRHLPGWLVLRTLLVAPRPMARAPCARRSAGLRWALGYAPGPPVERAPTAGSSFRYLVPGGAAASMARGAPASAAGLRPCSPTTGRCSLGYDPGYRGPSTCVLRVPRPAAAWRWPGVRPRWRRPRSPRRPRALLAARAVRGGEPRRWPLSRCPIVPGNPRYLLFLMAPSPSSWPACCAAGGGRWRSWPCSFSCGRRSARSPSAPGALRADGRWRELRGRSRGGGRALLLHGLLPGHQDQLPLRRARRLLGQAGAHHHGVLHDVPRAGGAGARGGARRRERHRGRASWRAPAARSGSPTSGGTS